MVMKVVPEVYDQLPDNPVEMLLIAFGSQESIAAFCAVTPQAVWNWKDRGVVPYVHVESLSNYSGVPTWMLCPKHFQKGEMDGDIGTFNEGNRQG